MLHDLLGINKAALDKFLNFPEKYLDNKGDLWLHRDKNSLKSVSVIVDKYFDEIIKAQIKAKKPDIGAFANKSIYQLIIFHKNNKYLLTTDVYRYFPSINFGHVEASLSKNKELRPHLETIQQLYFNNNSLRKGLAASPAISEIAAFKMDNLIKKLIYDKGKSIFYSRYYDDLVFSAQSRNDLEEFKIILDQELKRSLGFELNRRKTKLRHLQGSKVLGLVFDKGELTVPKAFKKRIRVMEASYEVLPEDNLPEVYEKLVSVGTIIGSMNWVNNNSYGESRYSRSLIHYYDELDRLKEKQLALQEEKYSSQDTIWE